MEDYVYQFSFLTIIILSLSTVQNSATRTYELLDKSTSKVCMDGLMQTTDTVLIDIKVTFSGEANTDTFVLETLDPVGNFTITICKINFKSDCSLTIAQGCFCVSGGDQVYTVRYHSTANRQLGNSLLKINGEMVQGVKFPQIHAVKPGVSLTISGSKVIMRRNCLVQAFLGTTVRFHLCITGLNSPTLHLSYSDINETSTSDCISASYKVLKFDEKLHIRYEDKCHRNVLMSCSVHALESEAEFTTKSPSPGDEYGYYWKLAMVGGFLFLTISGLFCAYIKFKKRPVERPQTPPAKELLPEESFDEEPVPDGKSSASSSRRPTDRMSIRSLSSMLLQPIKRISIHESTAV